jgi:hypothetical protein
LRVKDGEERVRENSEEIEGVVVLLAVRPMRGSVVTWDVIGRGIARERLEKV